MTAESETYRPTFQLQSFSRSRHINEWPQTPQMDSGHLVDSNRGWRTQYPAVNEQACIACNLCFLFCPDAAIQNDAQGIPQIIDDWCKGCGICAVECPKDAIAMIKNAAMDEQNGEFDEAVNVNGALNE